MSDEESESFSLADNIEKSEEVRNKWMRQLDDQLNAVEHHLPLVVPFTQADSRQHDEADLLKDNMFFSGTLAHLPSSAEVAEAAENGGRRKPVKGRLREKESYIGASSIDDSDRVRNLQIQGYAVDIFRDDDTARWLHEERHLVPWRNDRSLLMDRFDCRLMVDSAASMCKFKRFATQHHLIDRQDATMNKHLLELLDIERYADLFEASRQLMARWQTQSAADLEAEEEAVKRRAMDRKAEESGSGHSMFQYSYGGNESTVSSGGAVYGAAERVDDISTLPPFFVPSFPVPPSIPLPASLAQHQLIEKTAQYVLNHGGQGAAADIFLRAKSATDVRFSFLYPPPAGVLSFDTPVDFRSESANEGDALHLYYLYLLKHKLRHHSNSATTSVCVNGFASNAQTVYESDDDEGFFQKYGVFAESEDNDDIEPMLLNATVDVAIPFANELLPKSEPCGDAVDARVLAISTATDNSVLLTVKMEPLPDSVIAVVASASPSAVTHTLPAAVLKALALAAAISSRVLPVTAPAVLNESSIDGKLAVPIKASETRSGSSKVVSTVSVTVKPPPPRRRGFNEEIPVEHPAPVIEVTASTATKTVTHSSSRSRHRSKSPLAITKSKSRASATSDSGESDERDRPAKRHASSKSVSANTKSEKYSKSEKSSKSHRSSRHSRSRSPVTTSSRHHRSKSRERVKSSAKSSSSRSSRNSDR